jgi:fermentation-respiration switch protein FrsA (DUF1100 family)
MLNLLLSLAGIFALVVVIGRLLHRYFMYIPDRARVAPQEAGLSGVEEIVFKAADGTKLIAWYLPAQGTKPTLLYFTGNSGNVANRAGKIRTIAASGYGVFMLNYRRYGGSEGRPTEARNAADAVSAYDCLRAQGVAPGDIVAYGESIGTAVATRLSLQREVQALVLEAPFSSAVDVGRLMWKWFPLKLIMVDQYRTIDRIGEVQAPLFVVHGGRDAIIPLDQARRVYHAANEPKTLVVVPQAGHNDLYERGAFERVHGFLEALRPAKVAKAGPKVEVAAVASGEGR